MAIDADDARRRRANLLDVAPLLACCREDTTVMHARMISC